MTEELERFRSAVGGEGRSKCGDNVKRGCGCLVKHWFRSAVLLWKADSSLTTPEPTPKS